MGAIRGVGAQAVGKAVAEIVRQVERFAMVDGAVLVRELGVPDRVQALGDLVVDDLVGFERAALVINPGVALGSHGMVVVVLDELVGFDQHFGRGLGILLGICFGICLGRRFGS